MNVKISVILPVFNVGKYIGECIDSLKAQNLDDLEFIFVDDCGPDDSMRYVEKFADGDSRVRIIRNSKNMGAGASRNAGIEAAKGEYISFVDPDDHVAPDYFARLYSCAVKYKVPVVKGRRVYIDDRGNVTAGQGSIVNQQIRKSVKHNAPLYFRFINEHNSAIFKRSLADNSVARYGNTALAEDSTFLLKLLYGTNGIALDDSAIYYYRRHPEAATAAFTAKSCFGELYSLRDKLDFLLLFPQDEFSAAYIRNHINIYFTDFCFALKDDTDGSVSGRKDEYARELRKQLARLPSMMLSPTHFEAIYAFKRYGVFLPVGGWEKSRYNRWKVTAWTDFLAECPDAGGMFSRSYAYRLLSCAASGLVNRKKEPFTPLICFLHSQYMRLDKKRRHSVLRYLPVCAASFIIRSVKYRLYGYNL